MGRTRYIIGALLAVLCTAPLSAQAQTGAVRGRIVDEATQQPLSGVQVSVGDRGALTREDGAYLVTGIPAGTYTLRTTMIGYADATQSVTIQAGQTAVVDLSLTVQVIGLGEIVATGYGSQRAGDITGSVKQIKDTDFNKGRIISPQKLIESKVAGVQVVDNNEPGGGLSIRIRGATSINASSEPLYVIDGQPIGTGAGGGISAGRD
ncbi:MAG TPA: carboxypeptidase regulatory-like domain-containing protein, partial [Longimicrobiales bacterium]|nr:carboxypeptidase regulatory-like domain-containing protein [Longimicrobiales bacterium]